MPDTNRSQTSSHLVDLQPVGRRVEIVASETLLDAARSAGVDMESVCGGEGWCGGCKVRQSRGQLSPITSVEQDALSSDELSQGYRLACQTRPLSDVKVEIPPESLAAQQRLQVEGEGTQFLLDPDVTPIDVDVPVPSLHDPRSDVTRLQDAIEAAYGTRPDLSHILLRNVSPELRANQWSVRLGVRDGRPGQAERGDEVVAVLPKGSGLFGIAVDVGTTKIAVYLVNLATGVTVAKAGAMNPQISYGEDVISRIGYTMENADGRSTLQARLIHTLNETIASLSREARVSQAQVTEAVVVGNTVMHHLFAGLPVEQLGRSPYVPAVSDPLYLRALDLGLELAPAAYVYLPANIAGHVGADHVAMALATGAWETDHTIVALDIGTNTEVTVARGGRIWSCSCASGPAFEGAHIHDGMRAAPGAIERLQMANGTIHLKTIDNQPAVGLCGSGILDAVSEMLRTGYIDRKGVFKDGAPGISVDQGMPRFTLVPSGATGHGKPIVVTRKDINEIQLAKAAIRTGVDLLLEEAGATYDDIEDFIVAGAFGSYLDLRASVRIGMFPSLPPARFRQVGNAAGAGARQMLVSVASRDTAARLARRVQYLELTVHPNFTQRYLSSLYF